jgi:hypothetical protein
VIRIIRWMLGLCNHDWVLNQHLRLMRHDAPSECVGTKAYFTCSKCKEIKTEAFWV